MDYKKIIESDKYSFLNTNEHLKSKILYLTLSGSIGYGTSHESSDIDVRGFAIENKKTLLGFDKFEQFEELETDTVIYGLKKFMSLALKGNPNIIELLGTKDEHIIHMHDLGKEIRDNKHLFLSKRITSTFGNYASSQLRRLQNALARDHYPQMEKEKHIMNSLTRQMDHFKRTYTSFEEGSINLYISPSDKCDVESEIMMDIDLSKYPLRDFTGIYSEMNNIVRDYNKLNSRNRKKDDNKLNKHAMHLLRLLIMGAEILETGEINTYREKENDLFMKIRKGKVEWNEFFEMVETYDNRFKEAIRLTTLPDEPDHKNVESLMMSIYERYYDVTF